MRNHGARRALRALTAMRVALLPPSAMLAASLALGACGSCHGGDESPRDAAPAPVESPVAAPDGLLAEAFVATPDALWSRLQRGTGGAVAIMPATFGGLVGALAGLDPRIGDEVDGASPAYAVLATDAKGELGYAVALKLADAARASSLLVDGDVARFGVREEGGLRILVSKGHALPLGVALARGFLLVGGNDADLARLGPYAYRTLPSKPKPAAALEIDVPRVAVTSTLRPRAAEAWGDAKQWLARRDEEARAAHAGRAPDFGDANALLACLDDVVDRKLAALGDVDAIRALVDADDDEVRAELTLTPVAGGGGALGSLLGAMLPGDTTPLGRQPADAVAALLSRDPAAARASDAHETASCVERVLGSRLTDADKRRVDTLFDDWSRTRGDWVTSAVEWGSASGLVVRSPVTDPQAADHVFDDLAAVYAQPAFHAPLRSYLHTLDATAAPRDVARVGKVRVLTLPREAPPHAPAPPPLGLAWRADGGELEATLGEADPDRVADLMAPVHRLDENRLVARSLAAAGTNAAFGLVLQPLLLNASPAKPAPAPLVYVWGRKDGAAWLRVDLAYPLLHEVVKVATGL